VFITIISDAQLPVAAFIVDDTTICPGTCTNFTNLSSNATSYHWTFQGGSPLTSTQDNPQNICYNTPGIYSVTLIASNSMGNDTLTIVNCVRIYSYPPPLGGIPHGDTMIVDPQGFMHIQWYYNFVPIPDDTLYWHVAIPDGIHTVVGVDSNGCEVEAADFGLVLFPDFLPSDTLICAGDCISFINLSNPDSAHASHQWHFEGATPSTSLANNPQNICYNTSGEYQVKLVMVYSAHSRSDSMMIHVLNCASVPENSSLQFSISPNPFTSELNLHFNNSRNSIAHLRIFNSLGEAVLEQDIKMEDQTINLSSLTQGIYFVTVRNEQRIWEGKIIK